MQRQRHVVGFGHVGDLAGFGDAAGVGRIRLDDVDVAFAEHAFEIPARNNRSPRAIGVLVSGASSFSAS
jgi:hypothetical protein